MSLQATESALGAANHRVAQEVDKMNDIEDRISSLQKQVAVPTQLISIVLRLGVWLWLCVEAVCLVVCVEAVCCRMVKCSWGRRVPLLRI